MDDIQRVKVPELPLVEDIKKLAIFGVEGPTNKAVRAPASKIFEEIERLGYLTSEEYSPIDYPEI